MKKRGQAAIEFLYIHGWAIFAVMAILGAATYMGVGGHEFLTGENCGFFGGLICEDFEYHENFMSLSIRNGLGYGINRINLSLHGEDWEGVPENTSEMMRNNENIFFVIPCNLSSGMNDLKIKVQYTITQTMHNYTSVGSMRVKVID